MTGGKMATRPLGKGGEQPPVCFGVKWSSVHFIPHLEQTGGHFGVKKLKCSMQKSSYFYGYKAIKFCLYFLANASFGGTSVSMSFICINLLLCRYCRCLFIFNRCNMRTVKDHFGHKIFGTVPPTV